MMRKLLLTLILVGAFSSAAQAEMSLADYRRNHGDPTLGLYVMGVAQGATWLDAFAEQQRRLCRPEDQRLSPALVDQLISAELARAEKEGVRPYRSTDPIEPVIVQAFLRTYACKGSATAAPQPAPAAKSASKSK